MFLYRLHFLADIENSQKKFKSEKPIKKGDVIELDNGLFHFVSVIREQETGIRLDLSQSAQDEKEAILLAEQLGHK